MPSEGLTCIHLDVATGCLEAIWVSKHAGLGHLDRLGGHRDLRSLHAGRRKCCREFSTGVIEELRDSSFSFEELVTQI